MRPQSVTHRRLLAVPVYAIAAAVIVFPLAPLPVLVGASVAAALGALVAARLAAGRSRLFAILLAAVIGLLAAAAARYALLNYQGPVELLGPARLLLVSDLFGHAAGAFFIAAGLRSACLRVRSLSILEAVLIAAAFAQLVAAHRHGAINRPFEIADPIIAMGGDPAAAFLLIGAAAALVVVLLLISESGWRRVALHLALVLAVLAFVLWVNDYAGLPTPPLTGKGLGLRGERQQHQGRGEGGAAGRRANDELQFRDDYSPGADRVPLAVVLLHDDYSPPSGAYYFRQNAFSRYDGRKLSSAAAEYDRDLIDRFPQGGRIARFVADPWGFRRRLETTVALLAEHRQLFGLESPVRVRPLPNPDPGRFRTLYRVTSQALSSEWTELLEAPAGDPAWSDGQRRHYTAAPSDPRYRELAERIAAGLRDELRDSGLARALAVSAWLAREGIYSLKSGHARAADPTADFLFGDRTGYCVHFAHASAFLLRALRLPARVATGYVVDESARRGGSTIVLSGSNSHAWAELFLDGVGWVVVDTTPERALDPPPAPPDPDLQRLLGEMVRGQRPLPGDSARSFRDAVRALRIMKELLVRALLPALLLFLAMLYLIKLWRRAAPVLARRASLPRLVYRAELDRLSEARLRRDWGESREGFAARLSATLPGLSPRTHAHLRAAFGAPFDRTSPEELRALARQLRGELRASVSFWRRMLGALNPWSWLRTR